MKQVVPSVKDLPENVRPVKFNPPEGMEKEINSAVGIVHLDPESGESVALEFMFEFTEQELSVLMHEPFLTVTFMTDHLHPFAIQTSYPYDPSYEKLDDHHHICDSNFAHENNEYWRCENPRHNPIKDRMRECDPCWRTRTQQSGEESGGPPSDRVG